MLEHAVTATDIGYFVALMCSPLPWSGAASARPSLDYATFSMKR